MAGHGARPPFPVGTFYLKNCTLIGFNVTGADSDELRIADEEVDRWMAGASCESASTASSRFRKRRPRFRWLKLARI